MLLRSLFLLCLFVVDMAIAYGVLYLLCYKMLRVDHNIKDKTLVWLLLGASFIIAMVMLPDSLLIAANLLIK